MSNGIDGTSRSLGWLLVCTAETRRPCTKANRRFKVRLRWAKRKAYNAGRSALLRSGIPFEHLPPVLVSKLEVQKRGALHAHLALPYTTPAERVFTQAFIDCPKELAPTCGLGFVQGWQKAEKSSLLGHEPGGCPIARRT